VIRAEVREDRTGRLSATFWLDGNNAYTRAHDLQGEAGPERAGANGGGKLSGASSPQSWVAASRTDLARLRGTLWSSGLISR
jgi:hypothetical protein